MTTKERIQDDDEPLTAEDLIELEAAELDVKEGRVVSHAEARRLLLGGDF